MIKKEKDQEQNDFRLGLGIAIGLLALVGIGGYLLWGQGPESEPAAQVKSEETEINIADLVERLNQAGAVLYGSDGCGHCQHQKEVFGEYFAKIKYVNYQADPKAFEDKGIQYFPTWIIKGKKIVGFQNLEELAELVK